MQPRGIGVTAFVLGVIAVLMAAAGLIVAAVAFAGPDSGGTPSDQNYGAAAVVLVIDGALFLVGAPVTLLAIILGIVAAVRRRGRAFGIVGAILGAIPLVGLIGTGIVSALAALA